MTIVKVWENNRVDLESKTIAQLMALCGSGRLYDDTEASKEFRQFIREVPTEFLKKYVQECLTESFTDSGLVLQDLVNEIGHRLGFNVIFGRYKGKKGQPGFDGIWGFPDNSIIVEVKTTDTYRINLNVLSRYLDDAAELGLCNEKSTTFLIVVLREDTGDLEAQVRGSRFAWSCRIIGVESLVKMLEIKENSEQLDLVDRIRTLLIPKDFTRLDSIVDLVLTAIYEGLSQSEDGASIDEISDDLSETENTDKEKLYELCIKKASEELGASLYRENRSLHSSDDGKNKIICKTSKRYSHPEYYMYWFGYHFTSVEILKQSEEPFLLLGCSNPDKVLLIPAEVIHSVSDRLNVTTTKSSDYYHLKIYVYDDKDYNLRLNDSTNVPLNQYILN